MTSRKKTVHHLSQSSSSRSGWVEGLTNLQEDSPATGLLDLMDRFPKLQTSEALPLTDLTPEEQLSARVEHVVGLMQTQLEVVGEALLEIGSPSSWSLIIDSTEKRTEVICRIREAAKSVDAEVTVLNEKTTETTGADGRTTVCLYLASVLVRRRAGTRQPLEVRVAMIGNVDSGKSTMVGVLTRSVLDDGRGFARAKVFKHGHEESTGRTSSIGQHNLVVDSGLNILNDPLFKNTNCAEYISRASKVVTLVDLAGHEKYFKTTAYGLTGHLPDYACVIVGANAGVIGMCKEHFGVAMALKVPSFFIITKTDICPKHILANTIQNLSSILKKPGVKKRPITVRTEADVLLCAKNIHADSLAPIFLTSSVTGEGLDLVKLFFMLLPQRTYWADKWNQPTQFVIDETFVVPGVGTVVAGTLKSGVIHSNSSLLLGPDMTDAGFKATAVKGIHYKRLSVNEVVAGQTASLALKKVKRNQVRKGMVLLDPRLHPAATWEFDADIAILTHSTTIQPRYQAVIHCEIVKQSARVVAMNKERLRSGDRALVRFRFLQRPEYLLEGTRFVFREGRTKGIGVVISANPTEPITDSIAFQGSEQQHETSIHTNA